MQQLTEVTRCGERKKQNKSRRLNESRWEGRSGQRVFQRFVFFSENSGMPANLSFKGYTVYHCLAALSAAPGCLSFWLLSSGSDSADVAIQILKLTTNVKHLIWCLVFCYRAARVTLRAVQEVCVLVLHYKVKYFFLFLTVDDFTLSSTNLFALPAVKLIRLRCVFVSFRHSNANLSHNPHWLDRRAGC